MKKIIVVLPTLPNYRKEFFNLLSARLAGKGMELEIFYGSTKKRDIKGIDRKGFKASFFDTTEYSIKGFTLTFLKGLKQRIVASNPDGVIVLFNPANVSLVNVLLYCLRKGIPYAVWSCGWIRPDINGLLSKIRERFLDYFERRACAHIAYHSARKRVLEGKGIPANSVFVAQNTIDTEAIMNSYNLVEVNKSRFNGELKILYVGGLIKGKCLEEAMSVVDDLISDNHQISFTIVGGGGIIENLKSYRDSLKSKNSIRLVGPKYGDELKPYFLESDVFLLPGSGGLAINEAMSYGLPIISTDGDGSGFDLVEGNGYLLHEVGNKTEMKTALSVFAGLPRESKLKMSEKSIDIIKSKATNTLMVKHFMEAIFFMLNK